MSSFGGAFFITMLPDFSNFFAIACVNSFNAPYFSLWVRGEGGAGPGGGGGISFSFAFLGSSLSILITNFPFT
jgi:hypothetical protein